MKRTINFSKKSLNRYKLFVYISILTCSLKLSSCGYKLEGSNPLLPNNAKTIAILPIQNQTFLAGIETDLSAQLNQKLRANSSLRISPAKFADLQLYITLLEIKTNKSEFSKEQISSGVKATMTGKIILIDKRINKNIWKDSTITVILRESLENEMENNSGISVSKKTSQLIKLFSSKIYEGLFYTF